MAYHAPVGKGERSRRELARVARAPPAPPINRAAIKLHGTARADAPCNSGTRLLHTAATARSPFIADIAYVDIASISNAWGSGSVVVRLLAFHLGETGSIPGFSQSTAAIPMEASRRDKDCTPAHCLARKGDHRFHAHASVTFRDPTGANFPRRARSELCPQQETYCQAGLMSVALLSTGCDGVSYPVDFIQFVWGKSEFRRRGVADSLRFRRPRFRVVPKLDCSIVVPGFDKPKVREGFWDHTEDQLNITLRRWLSAGFGQRRNVDATRLLDGAPRRSWMRQRVCHMEAFAIPSSITSMVCHRGSSLPTTAQPARLVWSSAGMQGRVKREIPEKTRRPAASVGTITTWENLD
ncbi:hypothetical protein PR048_027923 [Dryococelus australis]|uniref:Uncharacterized protein n=1 Tax=Dryococelus australis TaxID=614101 RepID=A0ABQ9GHS8_9NEOP|nr:hypothetical protein PR048_027923 [Dryococelus australis]